MIYLFFEMEIKVKMRHISFYFFLTVFCSSSGGSQGLDASSALGRSSLKIIAIPAMCKSWHRNRIAGSLQFLFLLHLPVGQIPQ